MGLAYESYQGLGHIADRPDFLDLAWTLDEREFLPFDVKNVVMQELSDEIYEGLSHVMSYAVQDPFAGLYLNKAVNSFFDVELPADQLFAGAGVGSLLAGLARLSGSGGVIISGSTYPDFPSWASRYGCVTWIPASAGLYSVLPALRAANADVLFAERPQLFSEDESSITDWIGILEDLEKMGVITVIDESNANYLPIGYSLARMVELFPGLIVLRGFSKAYQLGGLRLGIAIAGHRAANSVRGAITPLSASPLAVRIGRAILQKGDPSGRLQSRILEVRPIVEGALARASIVTTCEVNPSLPYVLLDAKSSDIGSQLADACMRGKPHLFLREGRRDSRYRISLPLASERLSKMIMQLVARPQIIP